MTDAATDPVLARLSLIEADVRKWKRVASVATLLALGASALAAPTLWNPSEIRVTSRTGGGMAVVRPDGIAFFTNKGSVVASLEARGDASKLSLTGAGGAGVHLSAHAIASLFLSSANNHSGLFSVGEHFSELGLTHGDEHVTLKTSKGLDASFSLSSGQERGLVTMTSGGQQLSPRIQLNSSHIKHAVVIEAGPKAASVHVSERDGQSRELTTRP